MRAAIFCLLVLFALPAQAADPQSCDITIRFSSTGSGVDEGVAATIKSYVERNRDIAGYYKKELSLEGDFYYCIAVKNPADRQRIFQELSSVKSTRGDKVSPVEFSANGFDPYSFEEEGPIAPVQPGANDH